MTSLTGAVLIAATLATGWVAGVLGHYAHTLMPALRRVDDRTFVTAFQAIDRAILNPWFMVAVLRRAGARVAGACWPGATAARCGSWLLRRGLLAGRRGDHDGGGQRPAQRRDQGRGRPGRIADLAAVRSAFDESRWATWNLVRTVTTVAAFGILVGILVGAVGAV